ncbi:MAG TPA: HAMP domain-containing sensor histidine kinase, partial [Polyangiaceae bacterium]|nr:HAMP domain-containing sensor histidine kinase [Polyangiaceae bacterium]
QAERVAVARGVGSFMAHELGTPLQVIQARAMMLVSGEVTGEQALKSAKSIADQATRMTSMISEMLEVVRRSGQPHPVDLLELAKTAVDLANVGARGRKVRVELDASSEPVHAKGEPGKLLQVMLNLVANGVQASEEGGTVHLATRRAMRSPLFDPNGPPEEVVSVEVSDSGSGIPKELIARIFKPFFTTPGAGEGAGLGLAIANSIVKDYGGRIDVVSEVGKGSRFTVYLPPGAR